MRTRADLGLAASTLMVVLASCKATAGQIGASPGASPGSTGAVSPVTISASPTQVAQRSDAMTFTAHSPDAGDSSIRYRWVASKGYLATNIGPAVSWTPLEFDHDIEPGPGLIRVVVSNSAGQTAEATMGVFVNTDGSALAQ